MSPFQKKHRGILNEFFSFSGKNSLRAYVPKNERVHYLRLIGSDTSKYEKNKFEERRAKNSQPENEETKSEETEIKMDTEAKNADS